MVSFLLVILDFTNHSLIIRIIGLKAGEEDIFEALSNRYLYYPRLQTTVYVQPYL